MTAGKDRRISRLSGDREDNALFDGANPSRGTSGAHSLRADAPKRYKRGRMGLLYHPPWAAGSMHGTSCQCPPICADKSPLRRLLSAAVENHAIFNGIMPLKACGLLMGFADFPVRKAHGRKI